MSDVFFDQLNIPTPDIDLGIGSATPAQQTGLLMKGLESAFDEHSPSLIVVYGDVNSTLAGALTAAKMGIPIAHVEAGLRSFDWSMPEEVNRRLTDQLSDLLFVTSPEAMVHLGNEGVEPRRIHLTGNPMIDTLRSQEGSFDASDARRRLELNGPYAVATIHRPANVDDVENAHRLVAGIRALTEILPVILPLHPRGRDSLEQAGIAHCNGVRVIDPLPYVEFLSLVKGADLVVTDSGGIQEETTIMEIPCLTVRSSTERPVTITHGTNRLVTAEEIALEASRVLGRGGAADRLPSQISPPLWDGEAGPRIAAILQSWLLSGSCGSNLRSAGWKRMTR
jgi:UDP-N-acetylglucosamine 2-epimerase (non-hydrolysing)